jgi:hypothetical protein
MDGRKESVNGGDLFGAKTSNGVAPTEAKSETSFRLPVSNTPSSEVATPTGAATAISSEAPKFNMSRGATSQLDGMGELRHVYPTDTTLAELHAKIAEYTKHAPDCENYRDTLTKVVDMLAAGCGGTVIIVLHDKLIEEHAKSKKRLSLSTLDTGIHTTFFRTVAKNVRTEQHNFDLLLEGLTAHNESDRWEPQELERLMEHFGHMENVPDMIKGLEGQPKDGAILLNHQGTVKGAALYMKYPSNNLQLMKHTPKGISAAGTRHNSSLGFAEWLGLKGLPKKCPGAIFVRSDGGGAHMFFPQPRESSRCGFLSRKKDPASKLSIPVVCTFQTRSIPTQKMMLDVFKDRILRQGTLYRKSRPVLIRAVVPGETVITLVGGRVTMQKEIPQGEVEGMQMVVRAPTPDQELYVLPAWKVLEIYEPGVGLMDVNYDKDGCCEVFLKSHQEALHSKGWKLCCPKPNQERIVYQINEADLKEVPTHSFVMHDKVQRLKDGDLLAMPWPTATELYFMNKDNLKTGYTEVPFLSQDEMLKLFKAKIMRDGVIEAGESRWNYEIKEADIAAIPDRRFKGKGCAYAVDVGVILAMDYPEANATEIYVLPREELKPEDEEDGPPTGTPGNNTGPSSP